MTEREVFEKWICRKFNVDVQSKVTYLRLNAMGRYSNRSVQIRWETWQEARAPFQAAA